MAKITVPLLPQATEEYDQSQMAQLIQTLEQLIFALNNTYTSEPLRDDDEAKAASAPKKVHIVAKIPKVVGN